MKIKVTSILLLLAFTAALSVLSARFFRVGQVPNGEVFSCNTCHTSGGGSPRNDFGLTIQNSFLEPSGAQGDVQWGPALAALESDNDGFTNGEELQDPNGEWQEGQPAPGDLTLVTNPGDPDDFPTSVENPEGLVYSYSLENNYPNPFNPSTSIEFSLAEQNQITLEVYNSHGEKIRTLVNEFKPAGAYKTAWNGKDDNGNVVSSGIYIYRIAAGSFIQSKSMVLLK